MANAPRLAGGQASARSADPLGRWLVGMRASLRGQAVVVYRSRNEMRTRSNGSEPSIGRAPVFEAQARPPRIVARSRRFGRVTGRAAVATDPGPWTYRRSPSDWRAARAAWRTLPSAGAAIGAMCTAARVAPCRRVPRASGAPVAAIDRAPKAVSTIATGSARGEDNDASRPPAWGITLPPPSPHPSESSSNPRR